MRKTSWIKSIRQNTLFLKSIYVHETNTLNRNASKGTFCLIDWLRLFRCFGWWISCRCEVLWVIHPTLALIRLKAWAKDSMDERGKRSVPDVSRGLRNMFTEVKQVWACKTRPSLPRVAHIKDHLKAWRLSNTGGGDLVIVLRISKRILFGVLDGWDMKHRSNSGEKERSSGLRSRSLERTDRVARASTAELWQTDTCPSTWRSLTLAPQPSGK
jgi:hypothetical protein